MARLLFFPVLLMILLLVVFLALRLKTMISLSKSRDIKLQQPLPAMSGKEELIDGMIGAVGSLASIGYQTEIHVNLRRISAYSRNTAGSGYSKFTGRSNVVEITRDGDGLKVKNGKNGDYTSPGSRWVDFWCGTSMPEGDMRLFMEEGMKIQVGSTGTYMQRKYTELLIVSPALPDNANRAFEQAAGILSRLYGKNLNEPGIRVRNFMLRVLINNLTSLPDYIEVKANIFKGDEFISDYLQNSSLLY